jgi:hypothetical protein
MNAPILSKTSNDIPGILDSPKRDGGWGPALTLLALAVSLGLFVSVLDAMTHGWKTLPYLHAQPNYKLQAVGVVLVLGIALYRLKHSKLQFLYGLAELALAVLAGLSAASTIANRGDSLTVMIALSAGIYIAVRGYENCAAGILRFRHRPK